MQLELELEGKVAVVTGASHGIGLAVTRDGSEELDALVASGSAESVVVDLSTTSGPADLAAVALARGAIDILINNVGGAHPRVGGFPSITDEDWAPRSTSTSWRPCG